MNDIMKIVKSLEESGLLTKGVSETIKNEGKEQKWGFLRMLLGTLDASLLGNLLKGKGTIRAGEVTIRAGHYFFAASSFNYQNEPKFNDVYSRNNLLKIKDGAYVINLDEFKSIGTHWRAFYVNAENATYFDSFGVEHIPKEIRKFIRKNILKEIFMK